MKARTPPPSLRLFKGPTVIAYSDDPVAAPKVAVDFAKANEKFVILGGAMGKTALDLDGVKALASLPSLDELRAKLVGLIQAPATQDRAGRQRTGGEARARHRAPMPPRTRRREADPQSSTGSNRLRTK